jgi:PAS domain S-box-containing protein
MRLADELVDSIVLQKLSTELISEYRAEPLYEQIVEAAIELMRSDAASIQILDPETNELDLLAWKNFHPESAAFWQRVIAGSGTTCGRALVAQERIVLSDVETCDFLADTQDLNEFRRSGLRSMQSTPLVSRSGQPLGMISTHWRKPHQPPARDLSLFDVLARQAADLIERTTAEVALRNSEERYRISENQLRLVTDSIPALVSYVGVDERYKFVNQTYCDWFGLPKEELLGKKLRSILGARAYRSLKDKIDAALSGTEVSFESHINFKYGGPRYISAAYVPDIAEDGRVRGYYGLTNDVTDLKKSEELLRLSQERMRVLTESFTDYAILSTDVEGRIESWNPGAVNIFGYEDEEIIGRSAEILFTSEDIVRGIPINEMRNARNLGRASDERWHVRKDGSRFFASGVMVPLYVGKTLSGYAKIATDLTERKRTAEALQMAHDEMEMRVLERTRELAEANAALLAEINERKSSERQRIELLQRLVTTQEDERRRIARDLHDQLGQRLTALRLKIASMVELCADNEVLKARAMRLEEVAEVLDSEIGFLAWELRPVALDELGLVEAIGTFVHEWSRHYEIHADFHSSGMGKIRLNKDADTHLYRIAQESLNNIAKHAKAKSVNVILEKADDTVILIVEDDGVGFARGEGNEVKKGGKGLGLHGMSERASLIGGSLDIESAPGRGTTIYAAYL